VSTCELSVRELQRAIRTRAVSSEEAVRDSLDRVDAINPDVTAVVEVYADTAIAAAREADRAVAAGEELGLLHGVPVTFKMNSNLTGRATTDGVAAYQENIATTSDPQVSSLLSAGAIAVGRTNCPAFSTRWTTQNDLYGATVNPWDPAVTPGGSSGGAAVAVATGMCHLAQGNDTAGSIRYPAGCCGVAGIRATVGRVPGSLGPENHDPPLVVQAFVVQGPLARSVDDLRLGLRAMEQRDPRDPFAISPRLDAPDRPPRVAVVTETAGSGLRGTSDSHVVDATRRAAEWLADAGYVVEEVELPMLGEAAELWWKLALTEVKMGLLDEVRRVGDPSTVRFFDLMFEVYDQAFGDVGFGEFVLGYHRRGGLRRELSLFMQDYPLILTPTSGEAPFPPGDDVESVERVAELMAHGWPGMSLPTFGFPGLGIGATRNGGAPIGVQLIGRPFEEEAIFRASEVIESRNGIATPVDPRPRLQPEWSSAPPLPREQAGVGGAGAITERR
jgi:amidase